MDPECREPKFNNFIFYFDRIICLCNCSYCITCIVVTLEILELSVYQASTTTWISWLGWQRYCILVLWYHNNNFILAIPWQPVAFHPESFIEDQAFLWLLIWLLPRPSPSPLMSGSSTDNTQTEKERQLADRGGGGGSQIIRLEESLVLYNSFNTL